jgi:MFS family permease
MLEYRQRALVATAAATRFGSGILMGTGMAVVVSDLGGSPFAVSMVSAAYFFGLMVFSPVWGAVADVTGRRRLVLVATSLLATFAVPLLVLAPGVWSLVALRGLYAVFAAGFAPVMLSIVSARGGTSERGRSIGFFNSARASGFTAGQLAAGMLIGILVPSDFYLAVAAVSLASTLVVAFVADTTPTADSTSLRSIVREVRRRLLPAPEDRDHLATGGLQWLYVALALRNMTVLGVLSLMPPYLTVTLGLSETLMGVVLAVNPAAQVVFMLAFGRLADSVGRKPLITAGIGGSGAFAVVAAAAVVPTESGLRFAVAVSAFLTIAAAYSAMTTGALAFIGDVAPTDRQSELMGLRSTAKGLGGVLGPPVVGITATVFGYSAAFLAASALAFGAAVTVARGLTESRPTIRRSATADD